MRPDIQGYERYELPSGDEYRKIRHYADSSKDHVWLEMERKRMSDTPDEFRREILMDETVYGGQPIYGNYLDEMHCPPPERWLRLSEGRSGHIPTLPNCLYFGGWDAGQSLTPAFTLWQFMLDGFQLHCLLEVTSEGDESMNEFAPRVLSAIMTRLPGNWHEVRHYGDATITQRSGGNKGTARDEARKHGINIKPVSNVWAPRYAAVSFFLGRMLNEKTPGLFIDSLACPLLRKGFQGAYKYRTSAAGDTAGPGAVYLEPLKNMFSHVHDSAQYPLIMIRKMIVGGGSRLREE